MRAVWPALLQESSVYVPAAGVLAAASAVPVQQFAAPPGEQGKVPVYELRQYQVGVHGCNGTEGRERVWCGMAGSAARRLPTPLSFSTPAFGLGLPCCMPARQLLQVLAAWLRPSLVIPYVTHLHLRVQTLPRLAQLKPGYDGVPKLLAAFEAGIPHKVAADRQGRLVWFGYTEVGEFAGRQAGRQAEG